MLEYGFYILPPDYGTRVETQSEPESHSGSEAYG